MSHFVAYILQFQEIIVYKIPPGGEGVHSQPKVYDTSPNYILCLNANEQLTSFKFTMSQPGFQPTTCLSRNRSSHCPLQIGATELSREKINIWSNFVKKTFMNIRNR